MIPEPAVDLTYGQAIEAITEALRAGPAVEGCPARSNIAAPGGELLLMPAVLDGVRGGVRSGSATGGDAPGGAAAAGPVAYAGVKIAGVAPANPAVGLPRITGSYLLLDGTTLVPLALLDGPALTTLRTPAVTAVALHRLAVPDASHLVLFGAGPQAFGHLEAVREVRPLRRVTVVARRAAAAEALVGHARELGLAAQVGEPTAVAEADLVICCTTANEPLFDGTLVPDHAAVAAVGSHSPTVREVDSALVARAACYVEARSVAAREAGDLLLAAADGVTAVERWTNLEELVAGEAAGSGVGAGNGMGAPVAVDRPRFFKSVGMAWEDLAVAAEVYRRYRAFP
ncbi:ornithine cyclodeaminase family protein [Kitasatospora sp. LaBMicrA B282]|uniref:ornithine cyclodeaminase family protein n=1 Tax=Kitasatospora sp. LaBMicrA B282 TaxID=3420949 RepID=UPI003D11FC16